MTAPEAPLARVRSHRTTRVERRRDEVHPHPARPGPRRLRGSGRTDGYTVGRRANLGLDTRPGPTERPGLA